MTQRYFNRLSREAHDTKKCKWYPAFVSLFLYCVAFFTEYPDVNADIVKQTHNTQHFNVVMLPAVKSAGSGTESNYPASNSLIPVKKKEFLQISNNCTNTYFKDNDQDNYGDPGIQVIDCAPPPGYVAISGDCDDTNILVNPGATELCSDSIDNNCDGNINEGCPCSLNGDCQDGLFCKKTEGSCNAQGVCTDKPDICSAAQTSVCGCDGQTYGSECEASLAGISISYPGACDFFSPVSLIRTPVDGDVLIGTSFQLMGDAFDIGSGIHIVRVSTDGGKSWSNAAGTTNWTFTWTPSAEGSYTIKTRAIDKVGNPEPIGKGITVTVAMRQPTAVAVSGRQITVDGNAFLVRGVGYSPVPAGVDPETTPPNGDYFTSVQSAVYDRDLPFIRNLGVNAIRLWGWNASANHLDFLDKAYNGGSDPLYIIVGFPVPAGKDIDPASASNVREQIKKDFRAMVARHKNHPAVLMWAIGNELNAATMYGSNLNHLFSLINEMAAEAHTEEGTSYHPVTTPLMDTNLIDTITTYDATMTSLDIWGANLYRGSSFGTVFTDYKAISAKPFVIMEYGIDAYDNTKAIEYEKAGMPRQAEYAKGLWQEIAGNSDSCIGGSLMSYSDEWWKGKHSTDAGCQDTNPASQGICGYASASHPDGYSNEEWWGIMRTVDNGSSADIMEPRLAYYALQALWKNCTSTFYMDYDGDSYGNPAISVNACSQPPGYVSDNSDCNDFNSAIHPGVAEICDNTDNNCDGNIDEGLSRATTCGAGVCTGNAGFETCSAGVWGNNTCNPFAGAVNEICDSLDNDCDGLTDEGVKTTFYRDADTDTYGDFNSSVQECAQPAGYVIDGTDCNDSDPLEHPGQVWYKDADNDTYSDGSVNSSSCFRPAGFFISSELAAVSGDCNDTDASIHPGAAEVCNAKDDNCNGQTDEGLTTTYYQDADSDGYGNQNASAQACSKPSGYVFNSIDCNDNDMNEHPGQTWYKDADNDGYSEGTNTVSCTRPSGYKVTAELTAISGDCDDNNASMNPGAAEICDQLDNDCDGINDNGFYTVQCPSGDTGIQCISRKDGGNDADNLDSGKPKTGISYIFGIVVKNTCGKIPQSVELRMAQRTSPGSGDTLAYPMDCSGAYATGASCTYETELGPAKIHKYYFEVKTSDGEDVTYPATGFITGPAVQMIEGFGLVGIPRDINAANLNASTAFGSSNTYRWDAATNLYSLVTNTEPAKAGEGYFSSRVSATLPEHSSYGDIQANEYAYQLQAGWNIISNPYACNVKLSDIKVKKGSDVPVAWAQAAINDWVTNALYSYNGRDWGRTYSFETSDEGATLVPWMGYWVYLNKNDAGYSLVVPKP